MNSLLDGFVSSHIIYSFRKLVMLGMSHFDLLTISITYVHLSVETINIHNDDYDKKKILLICIS